MNWTRFYKVSDRMQKTNLKLRGNSRAYYAEESVNYAEKIAKYVEM